MPECSDCIHYDICKAVEFLERLDNNKSKYSFVRVDAKCEEFREAEE